MERFTYHTPITVRLNQFEGPLDLLLYLIQNRELDISTVSICKITDQYLNFIFCMQELNFDVASEFLVMAATLLHWKSRSLLPEPTVSTTEEPLEDNASPEKLVQQLLEHARFQEASQQLAQRPQLNIDVFIRKNKKQPVEKVLKKLNITELALHYQEIWIRSQRRVRVLQKETVSIQDKIIEFSKTLTVHEVKAFDVFLKTSSRSEIVATFLAILELARLRKMKVYQAEAYANIYIELLESFNHLEVSQMAPLDSVTVQPSDCSMR